MFSAPVFAVKTAAEHFDFFLIADGFGVDGFGLGVVEDAEADSDGIALVLVPGKGELFIAQADAFFIVPKADLALVGMEQGGDGVTDIYELSDGTIFEREPIEVFEQAGGGDGGGTASQATASGAGKIGGFLGEIFEVGEGFQLLQPALVAGGAPNGKVSVVDGRAVELGGENTLNDGKGVEPGEDPGRGLVVVEAAVEFFTDGLGEAGDLADQSAIVRRV